MMGTSLQGFYRPRWASYGDPSLREPANGNGSTACVSCGAGILSNWVDLDELPGAVAGSRVAATRSSCCEWHVRPACFAGPTLLAVRIVWIAVGTRRSALFGLQ
jgi:hypothetical protein